MLSQHFILLLLAHISCAAVSEIIVVDEGDSVTLNGSTEQGVIQWYKGSQLLTNNSKTVIYTDYKMTENSTNITVTSFLELHNVGGDDTGNYSYQIMNEIGNSSIDFEIHVNLAIRAFRFSQVSYTGSEDDGYISVCMDLVNGTLSENVTIVLENGTNGSSFALPKLTYFALRTQPSTGQTESLCANISLVDDIIVEGTEKFVVCASPEQDYVIVIDNNCTDVYIQDNDFAWFQFSQSSYNVSEGDKVVRVCLNMTNSNVTMTEDITFKLQYDLISDTNITSFGLPRLTYKANDLQACCNIPIADDNILETTETFAIRVFPCSSELNYVIIDENLADIIIMDNDFAELTFLNESHDIREDSGHVNVCVNGTIKGVIFGLSVNASRSNITNGDLMIICNKTVQGHPSCFDIAVIDDDLVESTEMAAICGCSPQKAVVFDDCFDLILEDNDVAEFRLSTNSSHNISEDSGMVTICLELLGGILTEDVIIEVNLTVDNMATTFGEDFMWQSNFTFAIGIFQECFNFSILDDDVKEESEKFIVCVNSENPSVIFQGNNCTIVYITNNDAIEKLSKELNNILHLLNETSTSDIILETILSNISQVVRQSEGNQVDQTETNLDIISTILSNITNEIFTDPSLITENVVANMTQTVSSLLQWTPSAFKTPITSSRIVKTFEELVSHYVQQSRQNESHFFNFTSVILATERSSKSNLTDSGRMFSNSAGVQQRQLGDGTTLFSSEIAAIALPASLFEQVNGPSIGVFFGIYETATLLPISITSSSPTGSTTRQRQAISPVIAATVVENQSISLEDSENVTITFRLHNNTNNVFVASGSMMCVSWDFNRTMWTSDGCTININNTQNQVVTCHCNHLTNFAVLADVCTVKQNCLSTNEKLEQLNDTFNALTAENYEEAVFNLSQIVQESEGKLEDQNGEVLGNIASYFERLQTFLNGSTNISINVVNNMTQVISSLLQWQPSNINGSARVAKSSRILRSFELVLSHFAQQLASNSKTIALRSLTVALESKSIGNLSMSGRSFVIGDISQPELGYEKPPHQISPELDAIYLPPSLFNHSMIQSAYEDNVGLLFTLYNSSTLFPVSGGENLNSDGSAETVVGSRIIAATVGINLTLHDLEHSVTIILQLTNPEQNYTKLECVSWDYTLTDWTSEGCSTNDIKNGTVICSCNHLTNFAVLVNICLRQGSCGSSDDELGLLSYIGMSVSIVCLVITIISLLKFKIVRQKDISKYHIQFSLALLFMLIVAFPLVAFSSAHVVPLYGGCVTISVLVHYFTLVAVMWMGAEALLMFQKLVTVFYQITTKLIVTVSIVCWTVPVILVVIPLIVDTARGHDIKDDIIVKRDNQEENIPYCFLSHPGAFFGAFLAPILAVMVFNVFIFFWVIVVLVRHHRNKPALQKEDINMKFILRRMISVIGIMSLFGLTWLFAVLTFDLPINQLKKTFDSFFVIFNSFQGLFIFFFCAVLSQEIRESWKELLSCGRYQSKLLPHFQIRKTPKLGKSGGNGSNLPTGLKSVTSKSDSDTITMKNTKAEESESDVIKVPPLLESVLDSDELDKLSLKTLTSIKATVSMEETNVTNELHQEVISSDDSKNEEEKLMPKMRTKCYTIQKYQVEQVEVEFYSDSDKEDDKE